MNFADLIGKLGHSRIERYSAHPLWSHMDKESWFQNSPLKLEAVRESWSKLPSEAARVLAMIVNRFGAAPFQEEGLLQGADRSIAGSLHRLGLLYLVEAGIVFAVRRGWGEKLYFVPGDMFFHWHRSIYERGASPLPDNADVWSEEAARSPLSLQLLHMLAELKRTGMKRTAKGLLAKRVIDKCAAQIELQPSEAMFLKLALSDPSYTAYPLHVGMMLDLAMKFQLLGTAPDSFLFHEDNWNLWLRASSGLEQEQALLRIVMEQYALGSSTAIATAAAALSGLEFMKWYAIEDSAARQWCQLMVGLGWMERAECAKDIEGMQSIESIQRMQSTQSVKGVEVYRWLIPPWPYGGSTDAAEGTSGEAGIMIATDGDIYVPPHVPAAVRWQLEMVAARKQSDAVAVYRINEQSLAKALELGYTGPQVVQLLEAASGKPLPSPVYVGISGMMEDQWDAAATKLSSAPALSERERSEPLDCSAALFHAPGSFLAQYDPIVEVPAPQSLFSGLEAIPSAWLKGLRRYHPTTRRELLEQALRWRISVTLKCGDSLMPFVPERIESDKENWAVFGYEQGNEEAALVRLTPDMWQEMMLQLPQLQ
ncbi:helicase-associated domain-containing protein [Paenibacillus oenotherae]|uniref:Helicase-associated domain-containing protein n=1 Tax=Paenibacillus oenotherae TaxID=1435645 RepID=A0ABS7D2Z9_9BACL|nr:helicase-associated domain-containing protein [Paenibacillus oenotherae]MBW7474191.1 helicase-associated domain-containing protein [Paenibacillus oenotherae]